MVFEEGIVGEFEIEGVEMRLGRLDSVLVVFAKLLFLPGFGHFLPHRHCYKQL